MAFRKKWANPTGTKTYYAWRSMRSRCLNPENPSFHHYGARGITISPEWIDNFDNFVASMGECPPGLTLERKDNDGGYVPGNCRWATVTDQLNNQRRNRRIAHEGVERTVGQWARHLGVELTALMKRLERMPPERALTPGRLRVRQHGTRTKYDAGCRCRPCKDAHNARIRAARARRKSTTSSAMQS